MEKNGGSCAGKQRFHVFVTVSFSSSVKMSPSADSCAVFRARRLCAAAACRRRPLLVLSGGKRKDVAACVDLWPAVIARAGWMQG